MNSLEQRLERLRADRERGAHDLALEALAIARDWRGEDRDWAALTAELETMHPAIALLRNVARELERRGPPAVDTLRRSLLDGNARIADALSRLIRPRSTILSLSNSSTVAEALPRLRPRQVRIFDSLPGGEGRKLAERLENLPTEVFPDAAMGRAAVGADCALVGVDSFDPSGALVHKVGTLPLALVCRRFEMPLYAAGHSLKRVDEDLPPLPDDDWFDRTPGDLVTIVTEQSGETL